MDYIPKRGPVLSVLRGWEMVAVYCWKHCQDVFLALLGFISLNAWPKAEFPDFLKPQLIFHAVCSF